MSSGAVTFFFEVTGVMVGIIAVAFCVAAIMAKVRLHRAMKVFKEG